MRADTGVGERVKWERFPPLEIVKLFRAMSPKPNSAYLIDGTGVIRFRAQWANDTRGLERALEAMVGSRAPRPDAISRTVPNLVRSMGYIDQVLDRAGPQANSDHKG